MQKSRTTIPILASSSWNNKSNIEDNSESMGLRGSNGVNIINRSTDQTALPTSPALHAPSKDIEEEVEIKVDGSLKNMIKDRTMFINLIILLFLWVASAFDYYLINFQLKYIDGDIYVNTIVSSVSEVTAYIVSGALYQKIGPKISFVVSFIIGIIGSLFYIIFADNAKSFIPYMVLGSKFGISGSFNVVYLANGLFPPVYSSTTFGLCNFFARFASMLAPIFAEFPKPIPMTIFCIMAGIAAGVSMLLRTNNRISRQMSFSDSILESVHSYSKVKMADDDLKEVDLD